MPRITGKQSGRHNLERPNLTPLNRKRMDGYLGIAKQKESKYLNLLYRCLNFLIKQARKRKKNSFSPKLVQLGIGDVWVLYIFMNFVKAVMVFC